MNELPGKDRVEPAAGGAHVEFVAQAEPFQCFRDMDELVKALKIDGAVNLSGLVADADPKRCAAAELVIAIVREEGGDRVVEGCNGGVAEKQCAHGCSYVGYLRKYLAKRTPAFMAADRADVK